MFWSSDNQNYHGQVIVDRKALHVSLTGQLMLADTFRQLYPQRWAHSCIISGGQTERFLARSQAEPARFALKFTSS